MIKLPEMKMTDFRRPAVEVIKEMLKENGATLLTADGEGVCVVLSEEDFEAFHPTVPKPDARMVRVAGVLYREA